MKIETSDADSGVERRILIGMITSTDYLSRIAGRVSNDMLDSRLSQLIANWCLDYFKRYKRAPKKHIESIYEQWAEEYGEKSTKQLVEKLLSQLSGQYERYAKTANPAYLADLTAKHINKVRARKLAHELLADADEGKLDDAFKRISSFGRLDISSTDVIDVLQDRPAWERAFTAEQTGIIQMPGPLGIFLGEAFERDSFISFMGPEKRGKSFWLLRLAWQAVMQSRRVFFLQVGDMSQDQVFRRIATLVARKPRKKGRYLWPTTIQRIDEHEVEVIHKEKIAKTGLAWGLAFQDALSLAEKKFPAGESFFKLCCKPHWGISAAGILTTLQDLARDGWVPDVVVVDYADNLAPINGKAETRDQLNMTWGQLRAISQITHCCLITATQTNRESYGASIIRRGHASEDKRKLQHVTGMLGINVSDSEKERGLSRLNWVELREGDFVETRCVHIASCLAVADIAVRSCL